MKKLTMLAGASLLAIAGSAFAEQSLTDAQMDGVNAGYIAVASAASGGAALGNTFTFTSSNTRSLAVGSLTRNTGNVAAAVANNTSVGVSLSAGPAVAGSVSVTSAALLP